MRQLPLKSARTLAFVIAGILVSGSVLAAKPEWAEHDKGGKNGKSERNEGRDGQRDENRGRDERSQNRHDRNVKPGKHFDDQHRAYVRDYYGEQIRAGRCPPGLAKKHNGCMPPGQAKKWTIGRPLPRDVVFYEVPRPLVVRIGLPPSGYRYVRVAGDILMIAIGTALVVDAIQNLGGN